jgi:hypothetical protein
MAGCDRVFGLDRPPLDAAIDQAPPVDASYAVSDIALASPVAISETTQITAIIRGAPDSSIVYSVTADRGSVAMPAGLAVLGPSGETTITGMYTAPAAQGSDTVTVMVDGKVAESSFTVLDLAMAGNDSDLTGFSSLGPDTIHIAPIAVSVAGSLREVGLRSNATGQVRIGMYTDDTPRVLLFETVPQPLTATRTVISAPPVEIAAGTYWLGAIFEAPTNIRATSNAQGRLVQSGYPFTYPAMPSPLTNFSESSGSDYAFFLKLAYAP